MLPQLRRPAGPLLMLYVVACGGLLLLAFLLGTLQRRTNRRANGWLSFFLLCLGDVLLSRALPTVGMLLPSGLLGWLELLRLAMAPALYLSVVQFSAPRPLRALDALHFVPWLLFLLLRLPPLLGLGPGVAAWPGGVALLVWGLVLATPKVQAVGYWLAAHLLLRRHQHRPLGLAAGPEPKHLRWLLRLLWGLGLLLGCWLLELLLPIHQMLPLLPVLPILYLAAVGYLAYYALRQPELLAFTETGPLPLLPLLPAHSQPAISAPPEPAGRQPRLSASQLAYWQQRLLHLLATTKPYLQPDLSLPALAQLAGLSTHELSYVLNEGLGINFFQLLNHYRVAEAKRLLASPQHRHLSVLGIAYEAGFSSKTTFNTAFKKATGLSPSQYVASMAPRGGPAPEPPCAPAPPSGAPG